MKITNFAGLVLLTVLLGCSANPLPKNADLLVKRSVQEQEKYDLSAPPPARTPPAAYGFVVPEVVEFFEGQLGKIPISGSVPDNGIALFDFEKLPVGMYFDYKERALQWKPDFNQGDDPNDPKFRKKLYEIKSYLKSSLDPNATVLRISTLIVHDVPRSMNLDITDQINGKKVIDEIEVNEGDDLNAKIVFDSEDFSKDLNKIVVMVDGLPAGALFIKDKTVTNGSQYLLNYKPDALVVRKMKPTDPLFKDIPIRITLIAPNDTRLNRELKIKVKERRVPSFVTFDPSPVCSIEFCTFTVTAINLNGDKMPEILTRDAESDSLFRNPTIIDLTPKPATPDGLDNYIKKIEFRWKHLPYVPVDNSYKFAFSVRTAGVLDYYGTKIKVQGQTSIPPDINRTDWKVGEVKFAKEGEPFSSKIHIEGREAGPANENSFNVLVEVRGNGKEGNGTWNQTTDIVNILDLKPGIKQVRVTARSIYGASSVEDFILEVFPKSRPNTIVLSAKPGDLEAVKIKENLDGDVDILSDLYNVKERDLTLRSTVVLGSSVIEAINKVPGYKDEVKKVVKDFPKLVILSPQAKELFVGQSALFDPVKYGIKSFLSFEDRNGNPATIPFKSFYLDVQKDSGMNPFIEKIRLRGTSSTQANNPMSFDLELDDKLKKCSTLLNLTVEKPTGIAWPMVVNCVTKDKTIVVGGFEWDDLVVDSIKPLDPNAEDPKDVIKKWLKYLVN